MSEAKYEFQLPLEPPVSLNGEVFAFPPGAEHDGELQTIKTALNVGKTCAEKALTAAQALHRDEMRTVAGRHRAARDTAHKITRPACEAIDKARGRVRSVVEKLEAFTSSPKPPSDAREQLAANAICAALAGMEGHKRAQAIAAAITAGDDRVIAAVLSSPALVSNLDPVEHERFREDWRRKRMPDECARMDYLNDALTHLERGGSLLVGFTAKLYGGDLVKRGEQSEKIAQESLAAAGVAQIND